MQRGFKRDALKRGIALSAHLLHQTMKHRRPLIFSGIPAERPPGETYGLRDSFVINIHVQKRVLEKPNC
jgi:hypothetical protein